MGPNPASARFNARLYADLKVANENFATKLSKGKISNWLHKSAEVYSPRPQG
jgi:hypothetical protein